MRVVIADDDHGYAVALSRALAVRGVEVVALAADGRQAIAACRDAHPDVVILDLRMPSIDGRAAARVLAASTARPAILMVSAAEGPAMEQAALAAGADRFLAKDVGAGAIAAAVHDLAAGARAAS